MAVFFADSRLWLGGNLRCWLRKLATFEDSKMACSNRQCFGCEKDLFFSSCKATRKRKVFSQRTAATLFHCAQTNVQQPFLNTACHCELAVQHPFFESQQSCVCCIASLSHRFKSSPAIPGKVAVFCVAGYMMMAGHFCQNHVSSGDLNRPRSPEVRKPLGYFWFFSYKRKE